jgi:hypothetical protein
MSDEEAAELLFGHTYFQPHITPIQVFNRATDPMLPIVKPHAFATLRLLDERGLNFLSRTRRSRGARFFPRRWNSVS